MAGRSLKHDGLAEVTPIRYIHQGPTSGKGWLVVINHFEGEPEIWGEYIDEEQAVKEAERWNTGLLGDKRYD
jgi:hypothetical protein